MSRSGISLTLVLALAWVTLAQGQTPGQSASSPEARVGKIITVTEVNRSPEKCLVLQVWRLSDGSPAMQAKSVETGEMMSIVESATADSSGQRFRVFRWGSQGVPPAGCPVPPGAKLPAATEPSQAVGTSGVRQVIGKSKPSSSSVAQAAYLPPADGSQTVVNASMHETTVKTGPVIVGQPNVPVQLLNRPVEAQPIVQTAVQTSTPASAPTASTAPAPVVAGPVTPAPVGACCCEEGKIILVTEQGCAPQQCQILSVTTKGLGAKTMQVKNLKTGECFTIVEGGHHRIGDIFSRFCLFRGKQACPVTCSDCESCQSATVVKSHGNVPATVAPAAPTPEPLPRPAESTPAAPMNIRPGAAAEPTGSKYASSLLPPTEAPKLAEKQVIATSQPPSLAQTTISANPSKPATESGWKRLWSRPTESAGEAKVETLPKPEMVKEKEPEAVKAAKVEKANEHVRPTEVRTAPESKPEVASKTESAATPVKPVASAETAAMKEPAKQVDLPVPVPLIPLATTDPRPSAPPPQPPINPYSTMASTSMVKFAPQDMLPPMCPACKRPLPQSVTGASTGVTQASGTCANCQPPAAGMIPTPVSPSSWTRGPAMPVSQSPVMVPARRLMSDTEAQAMQNTVHLMTVLQASGVPSQREWAAAKLRVCDPQMHPYVVEALVTAARSDAAPMVRATAIQSLAQMKANTPPVLVTLESARQDRDPRVRDEAIQAVRLLTGHDATSVQPAVYRVER